LLGREHRVATPLGYLGAFLTNTVHRKAMGVWLERVVFSSPAKTTAPCARDGAGVELEGCAPLPFSTRDYRTRQVLLNAGNFMQALQASCSIPFVLQAVHDIPGAPRGAYWDGGITDYHMHLAYRTQPPQNATNLIAISEQRIRASGQNDVKSAAGAAAGLVLYPHFQHRVVPGWLDKGLKWRHGATPALDNMVVLSPDADWVRTLPNAKLPDRNDFTHYGVDSAARAKAWQAVTRASQRLVDEWQTWLARPDMGQVHPL
jgi:hypothetical protein